MKWKRGDKVGRHNGDGAGKDEGDRLARNDLNMMGWGEECRREESELGVVGCDPPFIAPRPCST